MHEDVDDMCPSLSSHALSVLAERGFDFTEQQNIPAQGEKGAETMDSSSVCTSYAFAPPTKPSTEIPYGYRGHLTDAQLSWSAPPQVLHKMDLGFLGVELQNLAQSDWNQVNPSLQ